MQLTYLEKQRCQFLRFDSLGDMVDEAKRIAPRHQGKATAPVWSPTKMNAEGDGNFVGRRFENWNEVVKAIDSVWDEGMRYYDEMREALADVHLPQPKNLRRRGVWSEECGDDLSLDRLQRGQAPWRSTKRDHRPGPMTVTIVTNVSTICYVKSREILWRGAAAVLLTEILEQAGYRVELHAANYVTGPFQGSSDSFGVSTYLKQTSDPLDVSTLVNAVSGWCFRLVFFASYSHAPHLPTYGLGQPQSTLKAILPEITSDEQVFEATEIWSQSAAIAWVRRSLEEIMAR